MRRQRYPLHYCAADHISHSTFLVHCQFSLHYGVYILELIKNRTGHVIVLCTTRSNRAFFFCFFPLISLHLWVSCFSVFFIPLFILSFICLIRVDGMRSEDFTQPNWRRLIYFLVDVTQSLCLELLSSVVLCCLGQKTLAALRTPPIQSALALLLYIGSQFKDKYLTVSEFGFPSIQGKLPCCMACKWELFNVFKTGMADVLVIIAYILLI